jgi:hypothetical protein
MNFKGLLKGLIRNYFIIFALIVITLTILRRIFAPGTYFKISDIFTYMLCALLGDLPSLILYSTKELTEREMRLRIILHFLVLEVVIITFANVTGVVTGFLASVFLALQVAVIYAIGRFSIWNGDMKVADKINQRLKALKESRNIEHIE